jgi:hypothetical protein
MPRIIKTRGRLIRKKRLTRKNKKSISKSKGGGCGCGSTLKGGNKNNDSFNNSLKPVISGGKTVKKTKKLRGGDMLLGSVYSNNPVINFGTTDGARNAVDLLYGNSTMNPSIYNQPSLHGFNSINPPLA